MNWFKAYPAKTTVLLSGFFLLLVVIFGQRFRDEKVLKQDVVQYYSYVPAVFLHGDLTMAYARSSPFYMDKIWGQMTEEGAYVQKYTMGLALMYAPTFFVAHAQASVTGAPTDGYSAPYELWIQIGAVLFLTLGLWFLRKVMRRYFSERTMVIVLLAVVFGTNLFYYAAAQGPMPHAYIFCLLSIFLHLSLRFHEFPTWGHSLLLALVGGLIVLIRPNHILIWLIPVLYDLERGKWGWWKKQLPKVVLWPLVTLVVVLPQLLYWKWLTGGYIQYTYGDEGFFFNDPELLSAWFSYRKGWLLYTPLMAIGLVGIFAMGPALRKWRYSFAVFFAATTYVLVSWWCWWYGGSYGQRAFIDTYPILAFGLAALITKLQLRKWPFRLLLSTIALLTALNLFQTVQFTKGAIHHDSMTGAAYWASFGKLNPPANFESLLETPDYDAAKAGDR